MKGICIFTEFSRTNFPRVFFERNFLFTFPSRASFSTTSLGPIPPPLRLRPAPCRDFSFSRNVTIFLENCGFYNYKGALPPQPPPEFPERGGWHYSRNNAKELPMRKPVCSRDPAHFLCRDFRYSSSGNLRIFPSPRGAGVVGRTR